MFEIVENLYLHTDIILTMSVKEKSFMSSFSHVTQPHKHLHSNSDSGSHVG